MNEEKILAKTYKDAVSVYRLEHYMDPDTEESKEREVLVYDAEPCAISEVKSNVSTQNGITSSVEQDYVVFASPAIRMLDNDRVIIITAAGDRYIGRAGRTFVHALSHGATEIKVEDTA